MSVVGNESRLEKSLSYLTNLDPEKGKNPWKSYGLRIAAYLCIIVISFICFGFVITIYSIGPKNELQGNKTSQAVLVFG